MQFNPEYGPDGIRNHVGAVIECYLCFGGGWLDDGDYAAALVPCSCTGKCPPDVLRKLGERITIRRTGNIFSIASTEYEVTYPDGVVGSIWSPPWHEDDDDVEDAKALEAAKLFWEQQTHRDKEGIVRVE